MEKWTRRIKRGWYKLAWFLSGDVTYKDAYLKLKGIKRSRL